MPKTDGDANGHGGGHGYEEDGLKKTETMKGNEKLKIQLLGRDYAQKIVKGKMKSQAGKDSASTSILATGAEKRPPPARTRREEDHIESEDDERGRSSLGKSKCGVLRKRRRLEGLGDGGLEHEDGVEGEGVVGYGLVRLGTEKRRSGYLDEVLADRAKRKRKKGRRKEGVGE